MNLKALIAKRDVMKAEFKAWLDSVIAAAQGAGRGLNEEERTKKAEFEANLAGQEELIRAAQRSIELAQPAAPVLDAGPVGAPAQAQPGQLVELVSSPFSAFGDRRLEIEAAAVRALTGTPASTAYVQVDAPRLRQDPMRGYRNLGELALAVHAASRPIGAVVDRRLIDGGLMQGPIVAAPTDYHQETGSAEGAMVPPAMSQAIWQLVFNDPLLDLLTVEPTGSNQVDIIGDETTPWGATGIQAKWRAEASQMTPSKLDTKTKSVRLHELYAFVLATEELLEDAPRLADRLAVKAPAAIRWKLVEAFMFGTGAGQPLGWAQGNYAGKVTVNRTAGNDVQVADIGNMFKRLLVADGPDRSFWVGNRSILTKLISMSVANQPVWLAPSGLMGAPGGTLLGRPLFWSEHAEALGTQGDLQLVNPEGYYATQRGPARFATSIHLYFDYAIQAFRWMFRFGGQPLLSAAVAAAKGADTKSHFVILN
jgi:HK97 family phage major capsid protein